MVRLSVLLKSVVECGQSMWSSYGRTLKQQQVNWSRACKVQSGHEVVTYFPSAVLSLNADTLVPDREGVPGTASPFQLQEQEWEFLMLGRSAEIPICFLFLLFFFVNCILAPKQSHDRSTQEPGSGAGVSFSLHHEMPLLYLFRPLSLSFCPFVACSQKRAQSQKRRSESGK